ncbi:MAG TPA: nucleoside phosphorylase [Sphingobacteriaceae bacterium]
MKPISEADLILNPDGSIYHLNLRPEDLAGTVITVGDPDRVEAVSKYFDRIELKKGKREFITHTGCIGAKRITVISTGIGTDNIDIVLNELDALVNIDFSTRLPKNQLTSLELIRIGTSGTLQPDIPVDSVLVTEYALGLDALMHYYQQDTDADEDELLSAVRDHLNIPGIAPYLTKTSSELLEKAGKGFLRGITVTAPGFYAPQGREVRARNRVPGLIGRLSSFRLRDHRITNLEMETAGIYALAKALGHRALSVNAILANRVQFEFSQHPEIIVDETIRAVLNNLA